MVFNIENCFVVIGYLGEWRSHKHEKWFRFYLLKTNESIYNNPSQEKHGLLRRIEYKQIFQLDSQTLFSQPSMPCCRCLPPSSLHVLGTFGSPLNWVGGGWGFSRVVATFSHVVGSFNIFDGHHRMCLNNPIFSNLGLSATCWVHFVCHHVLRPTSVDHPFSFLNSSWGLTGGKHYQEITIMLHSSYSFLWLSFLLTSSCWFVTAVCGSISVRELVKYLKSLQTDVELPSTKWVSSLFVFLF